MELQEIARLESLRAMQMRKVQAISMIKKPSKSLEEIDYIAGFIRQLPEFSNFMRSKDRNTQIQICNQIQYRNFPNNHILFKKGDEGDAFYTILSGAVVLFDGDLNVETDWKVINTLEIGRSFGEKAIETDAGRMCHARCKGDTEFLVLTKAAYKELLSQDTVANEEKKIKFIRSFLPNGKKLGRLQREKVMFMFHIKKAIKKEKIIMEGFMAEALYFIFEGECKVINESKSDPNILIREFTILSQGSFFGEESVILNMPLPFSIIVSSETAELLYIKKSEIHYLPDLILNQIRADTTQRLLQRNKRTTILQKVLQKNEETEQEKKQITEIKQKFRSASKMALKNIIRMIKRQKRYESFSDVETPQNLKFAKSKIEKMRNGAGFKLPGLKKQHHQEVENITVDYGNCNISVLSTRQEDFSFSTSRTIDIQNKKKIMQKVKESKSVTFPSLTTR